MFRRPRTLLSFALAALACSLGPSAAASPTPVGTARSINALDYFNGGGPLHVPEAVVVTDEVVEQVQ